MPLIKRLVGADTSIDRQKGHRKEIKRCKAGFDTYYFLTDANAAFNQGTLDEILEIHS